MRVSVSPGTSVNGTRQDEFKAHSSNDAIEDLKTAGKPYPARHVAATHFSKA
jgi:hypothetical protein